MADQARTVLVTGGAGFIGSNFVRMLLQQKPTWRVVNYDLLTYAGNLENLRDVENDSRYRFIHGDIRDRGAMVEALRGCDMVAHFAAESHVDRSILDSGPFISTNVVGTQVLLDACREVGTITRFLHVGTDEVYGSLPLDRPDLKFSETTPLNPNSPYSASKTASDLLVLAYHETFKFPAMVTRCSNNFGPYQFPEKVIPLFVTNLIDRKKVPLYGDGLNVRDWLHVLDHCEALLTVLDRGTPGQVYNIGGNNERANIDLTKSILRILGYGDEMIQPVTDRLGHDRRYAIDASKMQRELGWRPTRSAWPKALEETVAWYKANEAWWRPLKEKTAAVATTKPVEPVGKHLAAGSR